MNDLVAILTALDVEYQAVRDNLADLRLHPHPAGTRFEVGRPSHGNGRVALALVGKGNNPAAVLTERTITEFAPTAVIFVGIAGALWPSISLGDVVMATHVYAYHGGTSEDDGLKARPRVWEVSHGPDQIARHLARTGEWARSLARVCPVPEVHFGPIAAGEIVQDSTISDHARWIREHYNDAVAIEMEAAGVAQAGHLNNSLPVIVIRGISDRADGSKAASDRARWQPKAVANAAAFAVALAEKLVLARQSDRAADPREATAPATGVTNIATGNAQVGVQAGQIIGNVSVAREPGAPGDLMVQLSEFAVLLSRAHDEGRLDQATYLAAEAELQVATDSLPARTERSRSRLTLALKKLRGLIADMADLAAKVATIISAAKGL